MNINRDQINILQYIPIRVLIVDDNLQIRDSIKYYLELEGIIDITFAEDALKASMCIEQSQYDLISVDYDIGDSAIDGIGLLNYKKNELLNVNKIVYSNKIDEIPNNQIKECEEQNIEIISKTSTHIGLIDSIKKTFIPVYGLPLNPKFATMNDQDFILSLANELIAELKNNGKDYFSFGGESHPIKHDQLITEIENLTPLGKEYLGNWFESQKRVLKYLERKKLEK